MTSPCKPTALPWSHLSVSRQPRLEEDRACGGPPGLLPAPSPAPSAPGTAEARVGVGEETVSTPACQLPFQQQTASPRTSSTSLPSLISASRVAK